MSFSERTNFEAIIWLSFGGPNGPSEVMPFLENVTAGRNVPRQRLEKVAEQYMIFGGKSPINDQNRELIEKLHSELESRSIGLPIYFANRNWSPYLSEVVNELRLAGVSSAL
ncbi:ferrochelatase, partial [mine drainage metagenome]